ncbi:MAG: IPT/TIG domain-containing protein [Candidatus Paceibacterota bacterium]|jgi:hypothetical protein
MKNINKNSISYVFPALFLVSIFGLAVMPIKVSSEAPYPNYYNGYIDLRKSAETDNAPSYNPTPIIVSVNPSSSNIGIGTKTITITGKGFVSNSVVRINGSNRPTTFIDSSRLLIQITGEDTYKYLNNGGFFITVFNSAPGGGHSNAVFFTIKVSNSVASSKTTSNNNKANDTGTNFVDTIPSGSETENFNNLASNAIFGSNGVHPSGLVQWIFFAILILVIVILVRKVYGMGEKYHTAPLKHD